MKPSRLMFAIFGGALLCLGAVQAQPILMSPGIPYVESAPAPMPMRGGVPLEQDSYYLPDVPEMQTIQPYVEGPQVIELYPHVVYRDTRKIHPAAIPYLVEVPLYRPRRACYDCGPTCALIKICVPPCETPCVRVRRDGHLLRYDFGKYEVRVVVRRDGRVIVNYGA